MNQIQRQIRWAVNRFLAEEPRGSAARLAEIAGISTTMLSRFRDGLDLREESVLRLSQALQTVQAVQWLSQMPVESWFLVRTGRGPRVVKMPNTMQQLVSGQPQASRFQIVCGPAVDQTAVVPMIRHNE